MAAVLLLAGAGVAQAGWEEGVAAFKANNFQAAVQEFQGVVEKQPEFAGGQYMLGIALLKLDRGSEALNHLKKAYELETGNVGYQLALSQAYLASKRYGDAAQMLQKINPSSLPKGQQDEYHQMLALALDKSGNGDAALAAMKKVTETKPTDADAWYRYGTAAFNAGETQQGVAALEKAVQLDGRDPRKTEALAKALVRQARELQGDRKKTAYDRAVQVAKALATSQPTYENLLLLGEVQLGAADYKSSVQSLKQAAAKNVAEWYPDYYLSQAYTLLGQYDAANASAQSALGKAKDEKQRQLVWKQIGFAREKMRDYEGAKEAYIKAGDPRSAQRVEDNKKIAAENQEIEEENREIEDMEAERERLERELRDLGGPPRR
jgi:tetratricopeptide (TPR) repeat protein